MFQADDDLDEALKACANDEDRSISGLIASVMREYLMQKGYLQEKKSMPITKVSYKT